jgi:hypothetical protein
VHTRIRIRKRIATLVGLASMLATAFLVFSPVSAAEDGVERFTAPSVPSAFRPVDVSARRPLADHVAPGDTPMLPGHVDQSEIDAGKVRFKELYEAGRFLFTVEANVLDGFGRPAATGNGTPTKRSRNSAPFMTRAAGPETNSCWGCHNKPYAGGAGDFVANVFVLAQLTDPPTESVGPEASNERNTLGMNGSGAVELLAREMTADLRAIRDRAIAAAKLGVPVTVTLRSKGVDFGTITARPDGSVDGSGVQGVDADLVIKPFHQKGVVPSVRVFTNNAYNHHHGLESVERFGRAMTGTDDFDEDGVPDELSVGDITAATLFQVGLPIPGRALPQGGERRAAVSRGEALFTTLGCDGCHRTSLPLNSPVFTEPGPYNPPGNLRPQDVPRPFAFDLLKDGPSPRLEKASGGVVPVRAYTDLKRHVICDAADPFFCNEQLVQAGAPTNSFITRKLWDVGSSGPYGHRGDLTTMGEAILHHSAEGRIARDRFAALSAEAQGDVLAFLRTLQVLPEGSPRVVTVPDTRAFKAQPGGD